MEFYRSGEFEKLPPNPEHHRLSNIDREAKTATCSICGPTDIRNLNSRGLQCGQKGRSAQNARNAQRPEGFQRPQQLHRRYGLTVEQYEEFLERQAGTCAICDRPPQDGRRLHVDHDHTTGRVRGLLCRPCNTAIGLLQDDSGVVLNAAMYLQQP